MLFRSRQVNPHGHSGIALQDLHRLLVPGGGKHDGDGNGKAGRDESLETHVHAVTHPGVVAADDEVDRRGSSGMSRRPRLTDDIRRRGGQERAT